MTYKNHIRSVFYLIAVAFIFALSACAVVANDSSGAEGNPIFSRIEGKWDLASNPKSCSEGTDIHIIRFNKERTVAYFERPNPPLDDAGKPILRYAYTVIYAGDRSITMHLIGETRQLRTGDDFIWVIQEREPGVYAWRLYGSPLREPEPATFRKCQ